MRWQFLPVFLWLAACADAPGEATEAGLAAAGNDATSTAADTVAAGFDPGRPGVCTATGLVPADDITLDLHVELADYEAERFPTRQRLRFVAHEPGTAVRLFGEGHAILWSSAAFRYDGHEATFCTGAFAAGQTVSLEVRFESRPPVAKLAPFAMGLRVWRDPVPKFKNEVPFVTVGPDTETNGSPQWLFSPQSRHAVDPAHSGVPALTEVELAVTAPDANWLVVGPDGSGQREGDTWRFRQTQPMPIYALSFAASPHWLPQSLAPTASGVPITALPLADAISSGNGLAMAAKTIDWMEAHVGPYPYAGDVTLPVVPGYPLAMEHVGNVWHSRQLSQWPGIVAHEVVHQWWGNTVRIAGWEHTWLDEGMATWFTDFGVLTALGFDARNGNRILAADECALPVNGPLRLPDGVDGEALWAKRNYHYHYGALVLHMIGVRLHERFDLDILDVLREWYEVKKGQAVTTEQFRTFLVERTGDAAFWQGFFADWVHATPCPVLQVRKVSWTDGVLTVGVRRYGGGQQEMPALPIVFGASATAPVVAIDLPPGPAEVLVSAKVPYVPQQVRVDPDWRYVFALAKVPGETTYGSFLPP